MMHVAIAGAGLIGAMLGWRLAEAGHRVTLVDPAPGQGATAGTLGWINATFIEDAAYTRLRRESMALWNTMTADRPDIPVRRLGSILWPDVGHDLDAMAEPARNGGQPAHRLDAAALAGLEPALGTVPEGAVLLPEDAITLCDDPASLTPVFLQAAIEAGAEIIREPVEAILHAGGTATALKTVTQHVTADHVVIAAGLGCNALLSPLDLAVPMANRPGVLIRTTPTNASIRHVLSCPAGDLRGTADGRFLIAESTGDGETPDAVADRGLTALRDMVPGARDCAIDSLRTRIRPIPADGRPVLGSTGMPGLSVAVTHSGITLAPVIARALTAQITSGEPDPRLTPWRPDRPTLMQETAA